MAGIMAGWCGQNECIGGGRHCAQFNLGGGVEVSIIWHMVLRLPRQLGAVSSLSPPHLGSETFQLLPQMLEAVDIGQC